MASMLSKKKSGFSIKVWHLLLSVFILNLSLGGFATEYVVEFWGSIIKGVAVNVPFLPCAIAGLFLGEFTIPIAAVTWLISFI